jgi:hypothetical protein
MKLFYKQIEISTQLSKAEIAERLGRVVFPNNNKFNYNLIETMPVVYKGMVSTELFQIKRVFRERPIPFQRDTGFPIITGITKEEIGQRIVDVEMKLPKFDILFLLLLVVIFGGLFIGWALYSLQHANFGAENFLPLIALTIPITYLITTFSQETTETEKYLRRLFEAE